MGVGGLDGSLQGGTEGNKKGMGDGRRKAFPVLHPLSTVPPFWDPLFTSPVTASVVRILTPSCILCKTSRKSCWHWLQSRKVALQVPPPQKKRTNMQSVWGHNAVSPSRDISAPINHQSVHYTSLPCVCVCVYVRGATSGRFPVNTDLCDSSINDYIICDKTWEGEEVSEGLWVLGAEVPNFESNSPIIWCDVQGWLLGL